jgi:hypothetical protein
MSIRRSKIVLVLGTVLLIEPASSRQLLRL